MEMNAQNIKEAFEVRANEIGFCLDQHWGQYENPYINNDTALAYNLFKEGWTAANNIRDEELNGCVVVPVESIEAALVWMDEDLDAHHMTNEGFDKLFEHKPILEKILAALLSL